MVLTKFPTPTDQQHFFLLLPSFFHLSLLSASILRVPHHQLSDSYGYYGSQQSQRQARVTCGDMGTGKSSLVIRFVKESTIGAAFFSQTVSVNNSTVKFEIWDTAGQERYHSLAPMYYRGAAAAIIVYDITSADSFTRAKKWVQELQKQGSPNMIMALAGNKCDLEDKRNVTADEARAYAEENGLFFLETSAKSAANVNEIFYEIAKRLPRAQPAQNPSGMILTDRPAESRSACCSTTSPGTCTNILKEDEIYYWADASSSPFLLRVSIKMESGSTTDKAGGTTNFRCVQCGFPIETLYIQYSPGNIRLMKCVNCKAVADEYIECEVMILIIDLILHKPKVYRHLFYNLLSMGKVNFEGFLWKSLLAYLALDIYRVWVLNTNETEKPLPTGVAPLLLEFGKMLAGVIIGNLGLHFILYIATRKFLSVSAVFFRWKQILLVILVSSYFKIFLTAMMVWEFPSSVVYIVDIFVLSSNIVALKAITNSETTKCLAVCAVAHGTKYLAAQNNMLFT